MTRRIVVAILGIAAFAIVAQRPAVRAQPSTTPSFSIGLFGDLAYAPSREPLLANVLTDMDRASLAFVVHVGDLGSPRNGSCTDELLYRRLAQFRASVHPLIYTPGDNEWTDCHAQQGIIGGDPLERLAKVRSLFFDGAQSLGQHPIPLTRQSAGGDPRFAKYRENTRWELGGVTFITLHAVGSNNSLGRAPDTDAEFADRLSADLAWLRESFAIAKSGASRALMILQQANIFPEFPPFPGNPDQKPSGFTELRAAIASETVAFGKPVALIHGDSHYFRVDKPFMRRPLGSNEPPIVNFTRVETFGDPNHHWVEAQINIDDPNVFAFRPRIVPSNVATRP
jgi:hypothetical protein